MTEEKLICMSNGRVVGKLIYRPKANSVLFKYSSDWLQFDNNG